MLSAIWRWRCSPSTSALCDMIYDVVLLSTSLCDLPCDQPKYRERFFRSRSNNPNGISRSLMSFDPFLHFSQVRTWPRLLVHDKTVMRTRPPQRENKTATTAPDRHDDFFQPRLLRRTPTGFPSNKRRTSHDPLFHDNSYSHDLLVPCPQQSSQPPW